MGMAVFGIRVKREGSVTNSRVWSQKGVDWRNKQEDQGIDVVVK